jgi:hypothetical protein
VEGCRRQVAHATLLEESSLAKSREFYQRVGDRSGAHGLQRFPGQPLGPKHRPPGTVALSEALGGRRFRTVAWIARKLGVADRTFARTIGWLSGLTSRQERND